MLSGTIASFGIVVMSFWSGCKAVDMSDDGNRELGQRIGASILQSSQALKASENVAEGGGEAFQSSLAESLRKGEHVLVNTRVQQVIEEANSLAAYETTVEDPICLRKWLHPCPDGWDTLDDSACAAPKSYQGGCGMLQNFVQTPLREKARFAEECGAPWPCDDECHGGHDYDVCPLDWDSLGSGFCQLRDKQPRCMAVYNFNDMTINAKQEISSACGIQWACKAICQRDYSQICPEGWANMQNVCLAPVTYEGDCSNTINTTGMDDDQKRGFAKKCAVQFPCLGSAQGHDEQQRLAKDQPESASLQNGPVEPVAGDARRASSTPIPVQSLPTQSFADRFQVPSGPVDEDGSIHF